MKDHWNIREHWQYIKNKREFSNKSSVQPKEGMCASDGTQLCFTRGDRRSHLGWWKVPVSVEHRRCWATPLRI